MKVQSCILLKNVFSTLTQPCTLPEIVFSTFTQRCILPEIVFSTFSQPCTLPETKIDKEDNESRRKTTSLSSYPNCRYVI